MIRLPRLWTNSQLILGDDDCYHLNRLPAWLRASLSHLTIHLDDCDSTDDSLPTIQHLFPNIQHLTLGLRFSTPFSVGTFRSTFESLRLVSFKCGCLPTNAVTALFGSVEDGSTLMKHPPSIQQWSDTLEYLHLEHISREEFCVVIIGLSKCQWSHLVDLSLVFNNDGFKQHSNHRWLLDFQQLLTRQHLPVLQHLHIKSRWYPCRFNYKPIDFSFIGDLFQCVPHEFDQLLSYDVEVVAGGDVPSFPQPQPASLTRLHIHSGDSILNAHQLSQLRELNLHYGYGDGSTYELLSFIGHHHLPLLDTFRFHPARYLRLNYPELSAHQNREVIRMMNAMISLTSLDLGKYVDGYGMMYECSNHFPNLKRLHYDLQSFYNSTCYSIAQSNVEDVSFLITIHSLNYFLQLLGIPSRQLSTSAAGSIMIDPVSMPIRTFSLHIKQDESSHVPVLVEPKIISNLICLTHLTHLTICNIGETSDQATKVLADLSQLTQLELLGRVPELSVDILSYWTRMNHWSPTFGRLTILRIYHIETPTRRPYFTQVSYKTIVESLVTRPRLHTLQLPHPVAESESFAQMATLRTYVCQLNHAGRRPPLDLFFNTTKAHVYGLDLSMKAEHC